MTLLNAFLDNLAVVLGFLILKDKNNNMKQASPEKLVKPVSIVTTQQFPLH